EVDGKPPLSFSGDDAKKVIAFFVGKVRANSPSENVPFYVLHSAIGEEGAGRASPRLRQLVHQLNRSIAEVAGDLPHGDRYLMTAKKLGVHLNPSVRWVLSARLKSLFRGAYDHPTDPMILAEALPLRGQKLPARSRGGVPRSGDDDPEG